MKQKSILSLISLSLLLCLITSGLFAQSIRLTGTKIQGYSSPELSKSFERSTVFQVDLKQILTRASENRGSIKLTIDFAGIPSLEALLQPSNIVSDHYTSVSGSGNSMVINTRRPSVYPYISQPDPVNQSQVAITFAEGFLYGFFEVEGRTWYVEPLHYFERNQATDLFVVYEKSDVIVGAEYVCGALELEGVNEEVDDRGITPGPQPCGPPELELAIANKWNMVTFYGSAAGVEAHNIGVYNAAQANWDDEFVKPVLFKIVTQYMPNSFLGDPFPNTTQGYVLQADFLAWAEAGGFGTSEYDLGHVRTRAILYNPNGAILPGVSYLGELCTGGRYASFSENGLIACQLRHVVSHEMGHSFSSVHFDPPYNIMSPVLFACSDIWHVNAIAAINSKIENNTCLSPSQSCPVPKAVEMPESLQYLCTGITECVTLEDNPCVASYAVSTEDPYLTVTSDGNTLCFTSSSLEARVSAVMVTPLDYCGNAAVIPLNEPSPFPWIIKINFEPDCHPFQGGDAEARNKTEIQNELSVYQYQDVLNIVDLATTLRNKNIQIFDMNGRLLLEQQSSDEVHQIFLDNMPAGVLVVKVNAGAEVVTQRIMKF